MWSQYLEVAIGPDAEIFTKSPVLSTVGWGAEIGVRSDSTRSEEHTSELQSLMRISYAVFCLKKKKKKQSKENPPLYISPYNYKSSNTTQTHIKKTDSQS